MSLSRSSNLHADPLSAVLATLGARSVRRTRFEASGDWALAFPAQARLKFVALLRGRCFALLPGQSPQHLETGDVFLIGDTPYAIASDPAIAAVDGMALYEDPTQEVVRLRGDETVMLGGGIAFESRDATFLFDALPVFMRIARTSPSAMAVSRTLELLQAEVGQARIGGSLVTSRLVEVMIVEAVRAHISEHGEACVGWIGALADSRIGEALRLMHGEVARPWTVGMLAARVGMSRSAFSARFTSRVSRPPLDYLTHWRMVLARQMLSDGNGNVARVAAHVGYTSQSAFGQAFRRAFGHSPGWRGDPVAPVFPP